MAELVVPTITGVVSGDQNYMCLWFDTAANTIRRARVLAWRCIGPRALPVTLVDSEPPYIQRPEGQIMDLTTGEVWETEQAWLAAIEGARHG